MEIAEGRTYRVVVRFPWGERTEIETGRVSRDQDGTIRWTAPEGSSHDTYLDVIREEEHWVLGWCGGTCDVTAVISDRPGAPEP